MRATIKLALSVIMDDEYITDEDAYPRLRLHAADSRVSLLTAASTIIKKAA